MLVAAALIAIAVLLLREPVLTDPAPRSRVAAPTQAPGPEGPPSGALGPIDALGQEVKRPPAPTGPPPRLLDGTIDLGDGIWVSMPSPPSRDPERGEELLLPGAKALMTSRQRTDDPLAWCLPMGVMRYTPYPFRFIQNYTHKKPTHLYILYETMRTFRQVFLDGRKHPPELDPTWFGYSIGLVREGRADNRQHRVQRQGLVRQPGHAAYRAAAHGRTMDAGRRRPSDHRRDDRGSGDLLSPVHRHVSVDARAAG